MDAESSAQVVGYCFAQACGHVDNVTGEGIHISFNGKDGPINVFIDATNSINMYSAMKRAIETLERNGSESTRNIIKNKKKFEKLMSGMFKT